MRNRNRGNSARPSLSNLKNLKDVDVVMESLRAEHKALRYHPVERPQDLTMTYDKATRNYHVAYEGERYQLNPSAIKTAVKFAKIPSVDWLVDKPEQRFGEIIQDECKKQGGLQIAFNRHDMTVQAFVDKNFVFMDDFDLLHGMVGSLRQGGMAIRGMEVAPHPEKDATDYRLVLGEKSIIKKDDVFTMLSVTTSQYGLAQNTAYLGTWRLVCLNGMLSQIKDHKATWNHRGGRNGFFESVGEMLGYATNWASECGSLLNNARETKLSASGEHIAYAMQELDILRPKQHDVVRAKISSRTVQTAYDMWNVITDSAKDLELHARHRLEQASMEYLQNVTEVNQEAERHAS